MKNALIGLFAAFAAVSSLADVTRDTEWYKIPDKAKVGTVVDLADTSGKADKNDLKVYRKAKDIWTWTNWDNPDADKEAPADFLDFANSPVSEPIHYERIAKSWYGAVQFWPNGKVKYSQAEIPPGGTGEFSKVLNFAMWAYDETGTNKLYRFGVTATRADATNETLVCWDDKNQFVRIATTDIIPLLSPVKSVNEKTGNVSLDYEDVGAWDGRYEVAAAKKLGYHGRSFLGGTPPYSFEWVESEKRWRAQWRIGDIPWYEFLAYKSDITEYTPSHTDVTFSNEVVKVAQSMTNELKTAMKDELDPSKWVNTNETVIVKSHAMTTYSPTFVDEPPEQVFIKSDGTRNFEIYFPDNDSVRELLPIGFDVDIEGDVKKIGKVWTEKITKLPAILTMREPEDKTLLATVQYFD